jgi:hypothetical protein
MDPTLKSLETLNDPAEWVRIPNVPAFDEHEEDIWVPEEDSKGNVVKDASGKIKKRKQVWNCDESELEEICRANNERLEKTGDLTVIAIGHTDDNAPATQQPPVVGVAKDWRVDRFGPEGKLAAVHDWYIDRHWLCDGKACSDAEAKAKAKAFMRRYPRRSIELWRNSKIVDPISVLGAQTPQRDLGMMLAFNSRSDDRVRYSREGYSMAEPEVPTGTAQPPMTPPEQEVPGGGAGGEEYTPEMHHEYMKHCYSHPMAKAHHTHMLTKYAMAEKPAETEASSGAADPQMPPAPAKETFSAAGPGMGDAYVPGGPSKPKGNEKFAMTAEKYAKVERELSETRGLVAKLLQRDKERGETEAKMAQERDLERYSATLYKMVTDEGVDLSEEEVRDEAAFLVKLADTADREKHLTKIRTKYSRRPVGRMPADFTRLSHAVEGGVGPQSDEPRDQAEYEAAISWATANQDKIDFNDKNNLTRQAVRQYRASKTGTNGHATR